MGIKTLRDVAKSKKGTTCKLVIKDASGKHQSEKLAGLPDLTPDAIRDFLGEGGEYEMRGKDEVAALSRPYQYNLTSEELAEHAIVALAGGAGVVVPDEPQVVEPAPVNRTKKKDKTPTADPALQNGHVPQN